MEKEFNFTPLQCDGKKILQLIEDSKYLKLDIYFKIDDIIHHICFNINEDKTESDYEYYIDNQKFKSYIEFISKNKVSAYPVSISISPSPVSIKCEDAGKVPTKYVFPIILKGSISPS